MDVAASDVVPENHESVVVEDLRDEENGEGRETVDPPLKKPRFGDEVNRVAEIVLVLSALRRIRGGKNPTELEVELMVKARSKLAEICQEFAPKDIIGRDAIGAVIEDLGLNGKVKDQRLGFRAPKLTISEKLSLGKRKMEESKKQQIVSPGYTSHLSQSGVSTASPANNVPMAHHWPSGELKAPTSSVNAAGTHFIRDSPGIMQSRMERPQFKPEMLIGTSQGSGTSGNYFGNATSWSTQSHSTISFSTASDSKNPIQSSARVSDPSFRPFMSQTPPGAFPSAIQPVKGINYGQTPPLGNNHGDIAKIIHKVLQPRGKQTPFWNLPSREYMSKAMTCQMCQATINEVETVLICDACEKGYHLKCLQANNMKGVPKSEWHCTRCVQLYNGKPFPPKYGRVMRSATTAKMSSSTAEVQSPVEKKAEQMDSKANQETTPHSETAKATGDDATMTQADANNESQGDPIGNDAAKCSDSSKPVPNSENVNATTTVENKDPSKDGIEVSVSASSQDNNSTIDSDKDSKIIVDKDSKIIADPSFPEENQVCQTENTATEPDPSFPEENQAFETENSATEPPSLPCDTISNADQSQWQNTTPDDQEAL